MLRRETGELVKDRNLIQEDKGESQTEKRWVSILFNIRTDQYTGVGMAYILR